MSKIIDRVESVLNEKTFQIAVVSGILFFIVASPEVFAFVEKLLKQVTGLVGVSVNLKGNNLLMFHSFVFTVLVALSVRYILEPILHK